jgi:hypothetical protein
MIPAATLSSTPLPGPFLPPRTLYRFSAAAGLSDVHFGGVALGDPSLGITYQLWTAFSDGVNIYLTAPNTPPFVQLANVNAVWVGLAMDQNARAFITYADKNGNAFYYWFDSTIPGYRTTPIPGIVFRPFATLDDSRPVELVSSDVILAYVRAGVLYFRAQRDRFGVEYTLGAAPATLVQIGMNSRNRFQFAFQNVQGNGGGLPPAEWNLGLGINEPA